MLDKKINTLLFTHDCVIVPGLGGFVASPAAARYNKIQHTFIPPSRVIAFNVFLRQNDGLLANFISTEDSVSFSDAMKIIERYVERCFMELEAGRKFTIADIGQLYYDNEKNIQFSPDETAAHSLDMFGFTAVRVAPVITEEKKVPSLLSPIRESARREKNLSKEKQRKTTRPGRRLLNAGLMAGVLLWAMFNVYIIAPQNFNFSALNPFEKSVPTRIRPVPPPEEPAPKSVSFPAPNLHPTDIENMAPVAEEKINGGSAVEKKKDVILPASTAKKVSEAQHGNYFVVVGVFNVPSNAEKMLSKLRDNGYGDSGSIERENKPTIVYAARYPQKTDAAQTIRHLKELGMDSWLFAR